MTAKTLKYETILSTDQLERFCSDIANVPVIAFDTEFVSEDCYRPELCLVQVAAGSRLAIVDPYPIERMDSLWDLISTPGRVVIAHAAREETRFCYRYTGKPIAGLFDTQLAAGFVGMEYPASLGTLVQRLAGKTLPKGETRTNWRHRPLSAEQLEYALQDVTDLETMYKSLSSSVHRMGREGWVEEETATRQQEVIDAENRENWRRVSGASGLNPRQLETIRQIWLWREEVAKTTDQLPRRVMRDDLIVELAKRGSADPKKLRHIRGLERRPYIDQYDEIAEAIRIALETPDDKLPRRPKGSRKSVSPMLAQFLSTSIACISRQQKLAPPIVGNADDVRELLGYELDHDDQDPLPSLLQGWRGDIVGKSFRKLLSGDLAIRIADVNEEQPLEFIESSNS
jgi:ribonuclease D